ncbi:MAG: AarF/ABC1/UbiB kinase family protein [bacterium]|nr:AarF/ABC1/UbiB kinase family protein [bacterium]
MPRSSNLSDRTRERRLEVEKALADRGLLRGPRRVLSSGRRPLDADAAIAGLRSVLAELGPLFGAFGRYLSRRADLLPATDCLRFAEIGDRAPPSSLRVVDDRILEELGGPRRELFPTFEEQPFESRWLHQSHHARLAGGERVVVRVLHPGCDDLDVELDALSVLRGVLTGTELATGEHFDEVLADFRRDVAARLELGVQADVLQALGRDARRSDLLVVPQVYRDLSSSGLLTVQWFPGSTIDEIAAQPTLQPVDAEDVARRICLVWLQMALAGHYLPLEADLLELPDGRLAVTGGTFAELPDASRVNLWNYLRATTEHFPDRAAACLLREVTKQHRSAVEGELRTRVRQVVPFRDGSWSTSGESLGEYAVLHWRLLRDVGFRARGHLDGFYQGLFWAVASARRFAPQSDPMGEALRDFDWLSGWNQLRQMTTPQQMGSSLESYLGGLVELPQKIDRILSLATEEGKGFRIPAPTPVTRRRRNSVVAVLSLGLAMAALVLLSEQWLYLAAAVGLSGAWGERLLASAFLAMGAALLWNVSRRGKP